MYGSVATWLGKKTEGEGAHTHKWTVYVRGIQNEDLSPYIRRVTFNLHQSFEKPKRVIEKPPFAVTETGWGEFEIQIQIMLTTPSEKTFELFHFLRLFHQEDSPLSKKPVVSEHYDEIIFNDPPEQLHRRFLRSPLPDACFISTPPGVPETSSQFSESRQLSQITTAHSRVRREIASLLDSLEEINHESQELTQTIQKILGEN